MEVERRGRGIEREGGRQGEGRARGRGREMEGEKGRGREMGERE